VTQTGAGIRLRQGYGGTNRVSYARLLVAGLIAAATVAAIGAVVELSRFGRDDAAAERLLQDKVRVSFAAITVEVESLAHAAASNPEIGRTMTPDVDADQATRELFDLAAAARDRVGEEASLVAVTIYDARGTARAWAGRPSDLPPERTTASAALFVAPSPLGLRLVYLDTIVGGKDQGRLGSIAVEHVLTSAPPASMLLTAPAYVMPTDRASVSLRLHENPPRPNSFLLVAPDGTPLLDAAVSRTDLASARARLRRTVGSIVMAILGFTVLLLSGPLLDRRQRTRSGRRELELTVAIVAVLLAGGAVLGGAFLVLRPALGGATQAARAAGSAYKLLLAGIIGAAVVATLVSASVRLRLAWRSRRRWPENDRALFVVTQLVYGVVLAALLVGFERVLGRSVDPASVDLRHFSLHPWSVARLATLYGILLSHAAVLWAGALGCAMALTPWRLPRGLSSWHVLAAALWNLPIAAVAVLASARHWAVPASAVVLGSLACTAAALVAPRLVVWYRHAPVASRILALFMAFLLPALLVYPSVHFFSERATQRLIETRYAVEAIDHPDTLRARLKQALGEIDALPRLPQLVEAASVAGAAAPRPDTAFRIWSQTVLARERLTSDVELYDAKGTLVSPFALNFPEYTGARQATEIPAGCSWDVFGEALPFGAQERNILHAQRSVCVEGRIVGAIIVHVVFDFRTLPFVSAQSAYFEVLSPSASPNRLEAPPTGEVEFTVYGWGRTVIFSGARDAWPLDDDTFDRIYKSRQPFWTALRKGDTRYEVYFANDRYYIVALGYPVPGVFDHLVRLAELTTLAAVGYVLVLVGLALFTRAARAEPHTGRALLREVRASFYRKLFLAFVLASIVPVLTLAFVIRAYFAGLLLTDIQGEASRTAAVAQRVIEESDALLRRGAEGVAPFGDDVMVWISQLINQDVNIFDGPELFATSERDLFASGLLPTRTPDDVYRAIVLQRLPSFVTEDEISAVPYMLAATPVRTGGRNAVLTVPLAFRQQEVEREIDELDRGVHLAALFFILLGAAIGLSMAERIADPVRQLTRATGRIARGDFDARIAVRSSDELRRLVDAFNGMAAELKAQRDQLERTHRLEAWAEMARQVAHEIKNPLTPIQLSAEHLRRVHADRGEPMGPVLEGCVSSILGQVRLLRQIAAEFSSFASSPTARRAPADPVALVRDVVEPYRAGLEGRVEIRNEVPPVLPMALVDRTLVSRALANIVENALHAMPGNGLLVIDAHAEESEIVIRVRDTGSGMDEEELARVFEPYFSTKTTGTGLGLPIARRNVELSGGSIAVDSGKGRGTTVTIRLPVVAAER
jgi:signal transduction histidine kinase